MKTPAQIPSCSDSSIASGAPWPDREPAPTGELLLRATPWPAFAVLLYLAGCAAALLATGRLPGILLSVVVGLLGLLFWRPLRRDLLLRGPGAPRRLLWDEMGRFWLERAGGRREAVVVQPCSLLSANHLWLVLQGSRRCTLYLPRRHGPPAAQAQLRRVLRNVARAQRNRR